MANPFKNFKLPIARPKSSAFDLSCQTITTGEFGQLVPIKILPCVPGDHISLNMGVFSRCSPLIVPTFGEAYITSRAFFVPNRILYRGWDDFITNNKFISSNLSIGNPTIPSLTIKDFIRFFLTSTDTFYPLVKPIYSGSTDNSDYNESADIYIYDNKWNSPDEFIVHAQAQGPYNAYNFTARGRMWYKILLNLGYQFNFARYDLDVRLSLLPLLSFLKVYADYYLPSQYAKVNSSSIVERLNKVFLGQTFVLGDLRDIIRDLSLAYDSDYFTSAWITPNSPLGFSPNVNGNYRSANIPIGYNSAAAVDPYFGVESNQGSNEAVDFTLNDKVLALLNSVTNYVTRNNFAGSRAVEQILARFGVRVPDANLNRPYYLGGSSTPLRISDVTNMAESDDYALGSYGGKALVYDENFNINFDVKEFGSIIVLSTILPKTRYFMGRSRSLYHLNPLDFYTPEFDKTQQAICGSELYACGTHIAETQELDDGNASTRNTFGFIPRYAEYKDANAAGLNVISGDYRVPTLNVGLDSYHLFREIPVPSSENVLKAQGNILYYETGADSQYNRIFQNENVEGENLSYDHFYMIYNFKIKAIRPMLSITEQLYFDHDNGNGSVISTSPNGNFMN